jgi:hypothetical protein
MKEQGLNSSQTLDYFWEQVRYIELQVIARIVTAGVVTAGVVTPK